MVARQLFVCLKRCMTKKCSEVGQGDEKKLLLQNLSMTIFFFNVNDRYGKLAVKSDFDADILAVCGSIRNVFEALVGAHRKAWLERLTSIFAQHSCAEAQFIVDPEVLRGARFSDLAPLNPAGQPAVLDSIISGCRFHRLTPLPELVSYVLEPVEDRRRVGRSTARAGRPNINALPLPPGAML